MKMSVGEVSLDSLYNLVLGVVAWVDVGVGVESVAGESVGIGSVGVGCRVLCSSVLHVVTYMAP